jgi:hypothetical protein
MTTGEEPIKQTARSDFLLYGLFYLMLRIERKLHSLA